jgi:hypothetical protein
MLLCKLSYFIRPCDAMGRREYTSTYMRSSFFVLAPIINQTIPDQHHPYNQFPFTLSYGPPEVSILA